MNKRAAKAAKREAKRFLKLVQEDADAMEALIVVITADEMSQYVPKPRRPKHLPGQRDLPFED